MQAGPEFTGGAKKLMKDGLQIRKDERGKEVKDELQWWQAERKLKRARTESRR